jgi:shikimate kinase
MAGGKRERTILLTGMMGCGKSVVGRVLAERLGWRFIDTDAQIERTRGCSVAEIFRQEGEAGFRALERAEIGELPGERAVVALGGGALAQAENRAILQQRGVIVWLDAKPETLLARIGESDDRPLLAGLSAEDRRERLNTLRDERAESYGEAEVRVVTDGCTPKQVCDAVLAALGWEHAA